VLTRLTLSFTPDERAALQRIAEADFRPPKDELRWLLRQEAQRRGLRLDNDDRKGERQDGR